MKDTRTALSEMSRALFEYPEKKLTLIGVTGTKGKTTVAAILKHILERAGIRTGLIGTLGIFDGKHYAHCRNFRDGVGDLLFKSAADRGADQYRGISLDDSFTVEELKTMYRVITGACKAGTEFFVNSLKDLKDEYTVREAIEMTKGQYGAEKFKEFFERAA